MAAAPAARRGAGGAPATRARGVRPGDGAHRTRLVPLALLALLAVAVRTLVWHRTAAMMNDGAVFIELARKLAAGQWGEALSHAYHPLYPLAIAAAKPFFAGWDDAGAAVSVLAGGAAVAALYVFLRDAFGPTPAWVGALLLAVHPYAVPFSADVQSEGLYFALFLGALAATWRALHRPAAGRAFAAGLLAGLAYLTRPEGLGVAVVGAGAAGGLCLAGRWPLRRAAVWTAALGLGAALCVAPYVGFVSSQAGHLQLTGKKSLTRILALEHGGSDMEAAAPAPAPPTGRAPDAEPAPAGVPRTPRAAEPDAPAGSAFGAALVDIAQAVKRAFRLDHLIIAGLGLWAVRGRPGPRAGLLLGLAALYGFVVLGLRLSAGYVSMRHVLAPCLPLLGYVALGLPVVGRIVLAVPRRLAGARAPAPAGVALVTGLALLATASAVMAVRPQREERAAVRAAAEWLAARPGEPGAVAAAKQRDAWYAGAPYYPLPEPRGDGGGWLETLRQAGVRHVIVDGRRANRYPGLGAPGSGTRLLHEGEAGGRWAGVFEILPGTVPEEGEGRRAVPLQRGDP